MAIEAAQTGLLVPTRAWLEELVELAQNWLKVDSTLKDFDGMAQPEEALHQPLAQAYGVALGREEVRTLLVQRRDAAATLLENKGVRIGRQERVL